MCPLCTDLFLFRCHKHWLTHLNSHTRAFPFALPVSAIYLLVLLKRQIYIYFIFYCRLAGWITAWKRFKTESERAREKIVKLYYANNYHKCANNLLKCISFHLVAIFIISILERASEQSDDFALYTHNVLWEAFFFFRCFCFIPFRFCHEMTQSFRAHLFRMFFGTQFFIFINQTLGSTHFRSQGATSFRYSFVWREAIFSLNLLPMQLLFIITFFVVSPWWQQYVLSIFIWRK